MTNVRCSREFFPAKNDSGPRPRSYIRSVVIHATGGPSAESAAAYHHAGGTPRHPAGSVHLLVDEDSCQRTLSNLTIPWGAPPLNTHGLHIEQAGDFPARWTRADWLAHKATINRCADHVAAWCHHYGIPVVWLSVAELRRQGEGARGITSHNNVSLAFGVSNHTDCADPPYPTDVFMRRVRRTFKELTR